MLIRDRPRLALDIDIQSTDGRHSHWSEQEPSPENVPSNLSFSTSMPGGFAEASCTLPRDPRLQYADQQRLSTLTVHGPGQDIVWQGRLEAAPRSSGDQHAVSPRAVGWQAHLDDRKDAAMVYVDRDLSRWGPMTRARKITLYGLSVVPMEPTINPDQNSGAPMVSIEWQDQPAVRWIGEALYDGSVPIASVYYDLVRDNTTEILFRAGHNSDEYADASANLTSNGTGTYTPATPRRFIHITAERGTSAANFLYAHFRNLTTYGNHGLTKRGSAPQGFYPSDVVRHVIDTWCPELTYTDDSVVDDTFVIPHLAFHEHVTPSEILRQATRFRLQDWAVWDNQTFWWHPRGTYGRNWRARVGPSRLEESGPQMERLWNSVVVEYRDVDGSTKTVGPTGSGADTTHASLTDTDSENPANKLGITRRQKLSMGVSTAAGAIEVGARFLEETKALDKSGKASLVGHCEDDKGVQHPAWRVRAGDTISFVDSDDPSPRRIVATSYSHDSRTCSVDLDAPPEGLAALLERLNVALVPLGF